MDCNVARVRRLLVTSIVVGSMAMVCAENVTENATATATTTTTTTAVPRVNTRDCIANAGVAAAGCDCSGTNASGTGGPSTCVNLACHCSGNGCAGDDSTCYSNQTNSQAGGDTQVYRIRNARWPTWYMYIQTANSQLRVMDGRESASPPEFQWTVMTPPTSNAQPLRMMFTEWQRDAALAYGTYMLCTQIVEGFERELMNGTADEHPDDGLSAGPDGAEKEGLDLNGDTLETCEENETDKEREIAEREEDDDEDEELAWFEEQEKEKDEEIQAIAAREMGVKSYRSRYSYYSRSRTTYYSRSRTTYYSRSRTYTPPRRRRTSYSSYRSRYSPARRRYSPPRRRTSYSSYRSRYSPARRRYSPPRRRTFPQPRRRGLYYNPSPLRRRRGEQNYLHRSRTYYSRSRSYYSYYYSYYQPTPRRRTYCRAVPVAQAKKVGPDASKSVTSLAMKFELAPIASPNEEVQLLMLSAASYPGQYLWVPRFVSTVDIHTGDPGTGGYWFFDPPLPPSIGTSIAAYSGATCSWSCGGLGDVRDLGTIFVGAAQRYHSPHLAAVLLNIAAAALAHHAAYLA